MKPTHTADGRRRTPVLVIGGGPVGLGTAIELAQHDTACIVVEPRADVSWLRPRAKTTSTRTMEHFRRWGIADTVRRRAPIPQCWSDEVVFCTTLLGREVTRFDRCLGLDLVDDDLVAEGGQQAPQPLIESIMRDRVGELPEVELLVGHRFVGLTQDDDGVVATVADESGDLITILSEFLVGCDGSRSAVREAMGPNMKVARTKRPNFNVVFRAESLANRMRLGDAVHYWVLNPGQPGLVGRLNLVDEWWCVIMGVGAEEGAVDPARLVHNLIGDGPNRSRLRFSPPIRGGRGCRYPIPSDPAESFLAGDAVHQNPPWGGHDSIRASVTP